MRKIRVSNLIKKIDRFRWQNYLKEYPGDLQRVQSLYWHAVLNDLFIAYDNPKPPVTDFQPITQKIVTSYQGIFMWPHRCFYDVMKRFCGLHFLDLNAEKDTWDEWKRSNRNQMLESIAMIVNSVQDQGNQSSYVHIIDDSEPAIGFKWHIFDSYHIKKSPPVSFYLKNHLFPGKFVVDSEKSLIALFHISLQQPLIDVLHDYGLQLSKSVLLNKVITEVETSLKYLKKIYGDRPYSYVGLKRGSMQIETFSGPTEAIKRALKENPGYKDLPRPYLKHIIQARYRHTSGKTFDNDSLNRALKRQGFI